jgi:uncharacterized membrane protein YoaK (UPF0700 family)
VVEVEMEQKSDTGAASGGKRPWNVPTVTEDVMLLILAWAAGSVDAINYLGLGHVFTANMTGNTVFLAISLGEGQVLAASRSVASLIGFSLGAALGTEIIRRGGTRPGMPGWSPVITRAITLEGIILALFAIGWYIAGTTPDILALHVLIVLSALAMGIQSAAILRIGVTGVATTYITGTITSLMIGFVGWLLPAVESSVTKAPEEATPYVPPRVEHRVKLQASVLLIYGIGAAAGGIVETRWHTFAILLPLIAVVIVAVNAAIRQREHKSLIP